MAERRRYTFRVPSLLPPIKNEAKSLFGLESMVDRVLALREAAHMAFDGAEPLQREIRMDVVIATHAPNARSSGDLDNFVRGICDSLMAANKQAIAYADPRYSQPEHEHISLSRPIAIEDDGAVVEIHARKVTLEGDLPWYEVSLEGE